MPHCHLCNEQLNALCMEIAISVHGTKEFNACSLQK